MRSHILLGGLEEGGQQEVKEKMVEILKRKCDHYCDQCMGNKDSNYIESLADYLISSGITTHEWISVKEPPKEDGRYIVYIPDAWGYQVDTLRFAKNLKRTGEYEFRYLKRRGWWEADGEYGAYERRDVSHWMPLPEPPKGE